MSVILLALPLTPQANLDEAAFARATAALRTRAPHGEHAFRHGQARVWLGWTHAGESPARVHAADSAGALIMDGRFDSPAAVRAAVAAPAADAAQLALQAWRHRDASLAPRLPGAWALVCLDGPSPDLVCSRDRLGQRPLFYGCARDVLVVSSDEWSVLTALGAAPTPDLAAVAAHFAIRPPPAGHTYFTAVREVLPGTLLHVRDGRLSVSALPWPRIDVQARLDAQGWAARWRETMHSVVRDALADASAPMLGLSGGLDSAAIAACAAGAPLRTLTWSLPGMSCDERAWSDSIAAHAGLSATHFDGSAYWPLAPGGEYSAPHTPMANPFRALKQAWYAQACALGARTAIWGNFGDHLYPERAWWLMAALRGGQWRELVDELRALWRAGGINAWRRDAGVRAPARWLLGRMRERPPAWLTAQARAQWIDPEADAALDATPISRLARVLIGPTTAWDAAGETWWTDRMGLDLRHPYRDWRLIELALTTPVQYQATSRETKALMRQALVGLLPEAVRTRPKSGSLLPFFRLGLRDRAHKIVSEILFNKDAQWPAFVQKNAVENAWNCAQPSETQDLLLWQCLSYERWRVHLSGQ